MYSGDHDYVVPYTGTRAWVYSVGLRSDSSYRPWFMDDQVMGGHVRVCMHACVCGRQGGGGGASAVPSGWLSRGLFAGLAQRDGPGPAGTTDTRKLEVLGLY